MLRYVLAILLLAANCFAQDTARMDQVVQSYASIGQFMGSVLVARDNDILFNKGYGSANLEWNIPNSPTTKFRLGSITKQFTAVAVLLLEEHGKLKIEDPIKKYLPDSPAAWDEITIFHVLTHTSGIPSITALPEFAKLEPFPMTPVKSLSYVQDKPLQFAPGENWSYSNSGYILLGVLIERVSGETYQNFIQKNIFTPLGMKNSGYDSNSGIIPQRASGYRPGVTGPENSGFVHMSTPFSAGALYSTTEDLLRWEAGLFGGKLLSPASLAKLITPFKSDYALGVGVNMVNGRKQISHGGGIQGFNAFLAYFPETKITVAALGNLNGNAPEQISGKLAALAHGETVELPSEKKEISLQPAVLSLYVGTYNLGPGQADITVTLEGAQLFCELTGQPKFQLFPESDTRFFLKVVDATVEFFKDGKGAVSHLIFHQGRSEPVARRTDYKKEPALIDGTWTTTVNGPDGKPLEVTYVLEGLGKTLLGTVNTSLGGGPFSNGKIDGNKISFVVRTGQSTLETTGTVSGDVINFIQRNGNEAVQFTARRVSD